MSISNSGHIRHNGTKPGFLYVIDESVSDQDAKVHPGIVKSDPWEWTTKRDLKLRLVGTTTLSRDERIGWLRTVLMRAGAGIAVALRRKTKPK